MRKAFKFGGTRIEPGTRQTVDLPMSLLSNHTPVTVPVHVVHGRRDGATVFISAAVHGDEILGVEIIRRLLRSTALRHLRGTLMCIPIVNVYGFINHSRYLPDRRDLNRSFPGTERGSLAAQVANLFMTEIVERCDFGIDLHSAAIHRVNLPQIRVSPDQDEALRLAEVFGTPVVLKAPLRDGSLRHAAQEAGVDVVLYEGGEALRFDEPAIRVGVRGILRVLKELGMLHSKRIRPATGEPHVVTDSHWLRAPGSGVLRLTRRIGQVVSAGERVGLISDPFGEKQVTVEARTAGLVIGQTRLPIVNQGDALLHVAEIAHRHARTAVGWYEEEVRSEPLFDEDEII